MLHWETVSPLLKEILLKLMNVELLKDHRLVGGTALSLHLGHRMSVDIDLFISGETYGAFNYEKLESYLNETFPFVSGDFGSPPAFGKSYLIGNSNNDVVKVDIFYASDPFFDDALIIDDIRLGSLQQITAMKLDIVRRVGRKKDFWDLHELLNFYSIEDMLSFHAKGFQWNHERDLILKNLINFHEADEDFEPICLLGKEWAFVKEDLVEAIKSRNS
ncbi:nucleotidyl transferase AbiEii/AbiGii toxin family protein [Mucilaginibacter ginkgonis]|uniref:Nucleotidyl transferase AbiEii/AbiGii toxin family protein n=1 Tax=Mucilaginibacter ginkgonis TaxID=2682091 RepID=A0A6I4IMK2_9SPHI|nr:nucleotidyl transferase AbiEii/AbiGii toxin family protein [Mucilaginibacter ginkgonis]QQL50165.1 nucleotidyl transferase AbiEii/AbiGii toxin family protein [Mucilaginibacter ginkgonis]